MLARSVSKFDSLGIRGIGVFLASVAEVSTIVGTQRWLTAKARELLRQRERAAYARTGLGHRMVV